MPVLAPILRSLAALISSLALLASAEPAQARPPASPTAQRKPAGKKPHPRHAGKARPAAAATAATWHPPEPARVEPPRPLPLELAIDKTTLPGGLRVVLNPDPALPALAIAVAYAAGPRHETQGQEGFASAAARAMTSAPFSLPSAERVRQLVARGASLSTVVTSDHVVFVDLLPPGALDFALWLEAERLLNGKVTEQSLQLHRTSVRETVQLPLGLQELAPLRTRVAQLAFQGYFPYEHDSLGGATLADAQPAAVQGFRATWYTPDNAVLTISGAFDPEQAIRSVHKFFNPLPRPTSLPVVNPAPLPDQTNQRSVAIKHEQTSSPVWAYGWAVPAHRQPEHDALAMAISILGEGPDARIARRLAKARLPVSFSLELDDRRGPSLLMMAVQGSSEASLQEARKLVDSELDALARLGPTTDEMRALWRNAQSNLFGGLGSADQRALRLATLELLHGDARLVHAEQARLLSISKDDIRKAVARFLSPTRRTLVEANASGRPSEAAPAPRPAAVVAAHATVARPVSATPPSKRKPTPPARTPAKKKKKK